jgi:hypothetical protein
MTPPVRALAMSLCLMVLATPAMTAGPSPELLVEAPANLAAVADEVRTIGRGDFSSALVMTGLMGFSSPMRVVLAPPDSAVAQQTPGWVSGFADGASRSIVLFPDRVSRYPDDSMRTLVHHEVAHVLVAEAARGRPVPRWFNEGVATVVAREWGIEDRARYAAAVVGRGPRTADALDRGFAEGGRRATRSYALSAAFVRWLRAEYGEFVTARILELLGRDMSFREAFVRATGDTLERAEHRFFVREALWHTWVPFLTSSGVLWAAITALAIVAIRRRRTKSAAMRQLWDVEEELQVLGNRAEPRQPLDFTRTGSPDDVDDDVVN